MAFYSGQGGHATADDGVIPVTDWQLTITNRLAEVTNSGSGGSAQWKKVLEEGSGSFNTPWDSAQIFGADVAFAAGDEIAELQLDCGGSGKFFIFPAIVESVQTVNNAQNDVVRQTVNFKANGPIVRPLADV